MLKPNFSEAGIRRNATAQVFDRGERYCQSGAVGDIIQRGNQIQALVEGSEAEPYRVILQFDSGGITAATCTCPYNFEGWCKHLVAAALVCVRQPQTIEERPTLEKLLDRLNHSQTQRLVQAIVAEYPETMDVVDQQVSLITASSASKSTSKSTSKAAAQPRRTMVDPAPFRRRVKQILREGLRYLEEGYEEDPITDELLTVIDQAQEFSHQGDGNNAMVILKAITETCISEWDELQDYGADFESITSVLDEAWTEAILSTELTPEEGVDLRIELEAWQDELSADFSMSLAALRQGWTDPALQAVLSGHPPAAGLWSGERPYLADDLTQIRLDILDRQERYEEYLNLAQADGQTRHYLTMLSRLGRVEESVKAAKAQMTTAEEALALAKSLREQEAVAQALKVAQQGLNLPGNAGWELAQWTCDLAEGLGDRAIALTACIAAFKLRPSFKDYCHAQELAGKQWATLKPDLLKRLRTSQHWQANEARVLIFLHEGMLDEAIATVSHRFFASDQLTLRVMDAAIADRPDWVIEMARQHAEPIMNQGKADRYQDAVDWLRRARAAYLQSGRQADWTAYQKRLLDLHARKRKLMGLLQPQGMA